MTARLLPFALLLALAGPAVAADEPWFTDVAAEAGLGDVPAYLSKWLDVDGDGWVDALCVNREDGSWRVFRSERGKRFAEFTEEAGIAGKPAFFLVAGDVDGDGDPDLFSGGYDAAHPSREADGPGWIWRNDGKGRFAAMERPVNGELSTQCAATFTDYDGDGKLDLFVGSWYRRFGDSLDAYPDRLYRGNGDGTFEDVTEEVGLMQPASPYHVLTKEELAAGRVPAEKRRLVGRGSAKPTYGVAAADWDDDGDPDLFTMSYGRQWNQHWRNDGGVFTEIGEETRFDGDGDESGVYSIATKRWFAERGVTRRDEMPFRSNGNTFDVSFGDVDGDGLLDAVLGEYTHDWAGPSSDVTGLLLNTGKEGGRRFRRPETPLSRIHSVSNWNQGDMCVAFLDLENDGRLDLLVSSHVYPDRQKLDLFRQDPETGRFRRVTEEAGLDWWDSTQVSLADYDRDGDTDLLVGRRPAGDRAKKGAKPRVALFRNDVANRSGHHFLSVRVEAKGPEAGVRVEIVAGGLAQVRVVGGGRGHLGHQDERRLTFGLGEAETVDRLEVRWGPGRTEVHEDVPADRFWVVREGAERPAPDPE